MSDYAIFYDVTYTDDLRYKYYNLKNEVQHLKAENERLRRFHDGCERHHFDMTETVKRLELDYQRAVEQNQRLMNEVAELKRQVEQLNAERLMR